METSFELDGAEIAGFGRIDPVLRRVWEPIYGSGVDSVAPRIHLGAGEGERRAIRLHDEEGVQANTQRAAGCSRFARTRSAVTKSTSVASCDASRSACEQRAGPSGGVGGPSDQDAGRRPRRHRDPIDRVAVRPQAYFLIEAGPGVRILTPWSFRRASSRSFISAAF